MEPPRPPRTSERKERTPFASIFAFENFLLVMGLLFGLQLVDRSFGPVLPLHLGELGYAQVEVPVVAGILFSVLAFTTALDNQLSSRLLKRHSPRVMIAWAVITAAAALAVFVLSAALGLLVASLAVIGLCMGTAITTAYTAGGAVLAREVHATGFGFLTSASLTGVAISPVLSGLLAAWSIRAVFVTAAVVLGMLAVVVRRVMVERNPPVESAPAVEES